MNILKVQLVSLTIHHLALSLRGFLGFVLGDQWKFVFSLFLSTLRRFSLEILYLVQKICSWFFFQIDSLSFWGPHLI